MRKLRLVMEHNTYQTSASTVLTHGHFLMIILINRIFSIVWLCKALLKIGVASEYNIVPNWTISATNSLHFTRQGNFSYSKYQFQARRVHQQRSVILTVFLFQIGTLFLSWLLKDRKIFRSRKSLNMILAKHLNLRVTCLKCIFKTCDKSKNATDGIFVVRWAQGLPGSLSFWGLLHWWYFTVTTRSC